MSDTPKKQISRLLADQSTDNIPLILQLIGGQQEHSGSFRGFLFGIAVFGGDRAIRQKAIELLGARASEQTVVEARRLQESANYHFDDAAFFSKWRNEEIDPFDVMLSYKMCIWHRGNRPDATFASISHQSLNLSAYEIPAVTEGLANFHFVRFLWLPAHTGFDLAAAMPLLEKLPLESVYIESNKLTHFPVELFRLPRLKTLSIRKGKHRPRVPVTVPKVEQSGSGTLENLVIEGYPIEAADNLGPFPALREVDIHRCRLKELRFLSHSPLIERLRLKGNQLRELPSFLGHFNHLRELDLSENPWQRIELDLSNLGALQKFHLSR